jgi:hypothetical protein
MFVHGSIGIFSPAPNSSGIQPVRRCQQLVPSLGEWFAIQHSCLELFQHLIKRFGVPRIICLHRQAGISLIHG